MRWLAGGVLALCACGGQTTNGADAGNEGGTPTNVIATYAIDTLFLGEAGRDGGAPSNTAWKDYGFNLDGLVTTKTSTNVCTLQPGASLGEQVDGTNGTDNSWGSALLPVFETALSLPTPSVTETQSIHTGAWTVQIQIVGLSDEPTQTAQGLVLRVFTSGPYGSGTPTFDLTTDWPVLSTSLIDGTNLASGAAMVFNDASITNGTIVAKAGPDPLVLSLELGGVPIELRLHASAIICDHWTPTDLTAGTIVGVLDAQEFITSVKAVAGALSPSLCGTAFDGVAQQILQASDIMNDGTNKPGPTCNGISVGIGFNAKRVANPTKVVPPPTPPPNPCP